MRTKKKEKSKSLNIALYFVFFVFFIILVSLLLKAFEEVGKSKFNGKNRFTVAVINKNSADLVSVSRREGSLIRFHIEDIPNLNKLRSLSIPVDSYVKSESFYFESPKLYFAKMLFSKRNLETDLSMVDLLKLSVYSFGTPNEKVREEASSIKESEQLSVLISSLFIDEAISSEKASIQITNATEVSGLGNKIAKYLTNMGGSVVLVNSSKETLGKSKIIYRQDSYTVRKISQILEIPAEKKEMNSISDIIIIIGKDKEGF